MKRRCVKTASSMLGMATIAVLALGDQEALAAVSRALGAGAEALREAASASAVILGAGANVTASLAQVSRAAVSSSSTFASEVWHGIDILNLEMSRWAFRGKNRNRRQ